MRYSDLLTRIVMFSNYDGFFWEKKGWKRKTEEEPIYIYSVILAISTLHGEDSKKSFATSIKWVLRWWNHYWRNRRFCSKLQKKNYRNFEMIWALRAPWNVSNFHFFVNKLFILIKYILIFGCRYSRKI